MVTSFSRPLLHPALLHGIEICCKESPHTTTFANLYSDTGKRRQLIEGVADQIESDQIPKAWRSANIVNICPVANEYHSDIIQAFDHALIGVCPQGWMRQWDDQGHVSQKVWDSFKEVLPHAPGGGTPRKRWSFLRVGKRCAVRPECAPGTTGHHTATIRVERQGRRHAASSICKSSGRLRMA